VAENLDTQDIISCDTDDGTMVLSQVLSRSIAASNINASMYFMLLPATSVVYNLLRQSPSQSYAIDLMS